MEHLTWLIGILLADEHDTPKCDYYGNCRNKAYREVYYEKNGSMVWSYLCRKHFEQEKKTKKIDCWCSIY